MATKKTIHRYQITVAIIRINSTIHAAGAQIGFVNQGTSTVTINQFPLVPGASLWPGFANNPGDLDITDYLVQFIPGTGTNNQLYAVRKTYVD